MRGGEGWLGQVGAVESKNITNASQFNSGLTAYVGSVWQSDENVAEHRKRTSE